MKKIERNICRNRLKVILIGWWRIRKNRHCHSIFTTMERYWLG